MRLSLTSRAMEKPFLRYDSTWADDFFAFSRDYTRETELYTASTILSQLAMGMKSRSGIDCHFFFGSQLRKSIYCMPVCAALINLAMTGYWVIMVWMTGCWVNLVATAVITTVLVACDATWRWMWEPDFCLWLPLIYVLLHIQSPNLWHHVCDDTFQLYWCIALMLTTPDNVSEAWQTPSLCSRKRMF